MARTTSSQGGIPKLSICVLLKQFEFRTHERVGRHRSPVCRQEANLRFRCRPAHDGVVDATPSDVALSEQENDRQMATGTQDQRGLWECSEECLLCLYRTQRARC